MDHLLELRAEADVAEHLQMGGKDGGVFWAELGSDSVPIPLDLGAGRVDGGGQAFQFVFDCVSRYETARDAKSLGINNERFADRNTG
jgi:hypothetical protein